MPIAGWAVNCIAHLAIYQATLLALRRTTGRLVFIGSLSGRVASPLKTGYVASKFGLEGLVAVMRIYRTTDEKPQVNTEELAWIRQDNAPPR